MVGFWTHPQLLHLPAAHNNLSPLFKVVVIFKIHINYKEPEISNCQWMSHCLWCVDGPVMFRLFSVRGDHVPIDLWFLFVVDSIMVIKERPRPCALIFMCILLIVLCERFIDTTAAATKSSATSSFSAVAVPQSQKILNFNVCLLIY